MGQKTTALTAHLIEGHASVLGDTDAQEVDVMGVGSVGHALVDAGVHQVNLGQNNYHAQAPLHEPRVQVLQHLQHCCIIRHCPACMPVYPVLTFRARFDKVRLDSDICKASRSSWP